MIPELNLEEIRPIVENALQEDIGAGDITTEKVIPADIECSGAIVAKADGVVAGLPVAEFVFHSLDKRIKLARKVQEGDVVNAGQVVMDVSGWARAVLSAERTTLNFLSHLSGIATLTKEFVDKVKDYNVAILDTRKTMPGLRILEKYAVCAGGGENHRMGLYSQILIKDNHLKIQKELGAGYIHRAIVSAKKNYSGKVEIEVESMEEAEDAISAGVDILMLDNMSIDDIHEVVNRFRGKVLFEVSGGVNLQNVQDIAKAGVNFISIGALTHSAPSHDFSLDIF
jgi:nicotinate-nucleotide pyrophosphorylase (carboxylating)